MINQIISEWKTRILESETYENESIISRLDYTIIWQEQAKKEIAMAISDSIHQIVHKNWPIAVLLFVWPTGTGKSESVKAIANILLWDRDNIVKMNWEQFQESHTVGRLFGSPPAYVGYNDPPLLELISKKQKEAMESKTVSHIVKRLGGLNILLIDEIEKVHPKVLQSLLAVFDDWSCTLANGKKVELTSTLIICTSNIGETEKRENREKPSMGFTPSKVWDDTKIFENAMKIFSPEFQGRIDSVVHFHSLSQENAIAIVDKLTNELNDTLDRISDWTFTRVKLTLTDTAKQLILSKWFSAEKWVRELNRTYKRLIDSPLWRVLNLHSDMHEFPEFKVKITADEKDWKIIFYIDPKNIEEIKVITEIKIAYLLEHKTKKKK